MKLYGLTYSVIDGEQEYVFDAVCYATNARKANVYLHRRCRRQCGDEKPYGCYGGYFYYDNCIRVTPGRVSETTEDLWNKEIFHKSKIDNSY